MFAARLINCVAPCLCISSSVFWSWWREGNESEFLNSFCLYLFEKRIRSFCSENVLIPFLVPKFSNTNIFSSFPYLPLTKVVKLVNKVNNFHFPSLPSPLFPSPSELQIRLHEHVPIFCYQLNVRYNGCLKDQNFGC